jgi:hypothetical protein
MDRDFRAFAIGLAVYTALSVLYFAAPLFPLYFAIPVISGGVVAYLSGRRQFAAVFSLGVVGAAVGAALNFVASSLGAPSDFRRASDIPFVAVMSLLYQVPLVLIGGAVVGLWLRWRDA